MAEEVGNGHLYGRYIANNEILKLYSNSYKKVSTTDFSRWMMSKTDGEYIVVPRRFVLNALAYIENNESEVAFIKGFL